MSDILPEALCKWFITHGSRFRLWHDKKVCIVNSMLHLIYYTLYTAVLVSCLA